WVSGQSSVVICSFIPHSALRVRSIRWMFSVRCSMFVLLIAQRLHRIDIRPPARGEVAREEGNSTQENGNTRKSKRVKRAKPEEQSGKEPGRRGRSGESYHHPQRHRPHALTQNQPQDVSSPSSQRHADADLVRAPHNRVAHHAVNPHGSEQQPHQPDDGGKDGSDSREDKYGV